MRVVVFLGDRKLTLHDFPDPAPGEGEVILAIKASGMCGSDLRHYRAAASSESRPGGPILAPPASPVSRRGGRIIAGHEPCGVVAAVGAGVAADFAPIGARVMNHHYKG